MAIRFGNLAKPYFLTTLKSNIGFGEFTEPGFSYKPLLTRLSTLPRFMLLPFFMSFHFKTGFGNLAKPDFTYLHSGNSADKFPPAGGIGDWGYPRKRGCHTNAMLASMPPTGGVGGGKFTC